VPKDGSSADGSGGSQGQTGPRSEASTNDDKAKPDAKKSPEELAVEQIKAEGKKIEASAEVRTNTQ
jgi:hypothetical protein